MVHVCRITCPSERRRRDSRKNDEHEYPPPARGGIADRCAARRESPGEAAGSRPIQTEFNRLMRPVWSTDSEAGCFQLCATALCSREAPRRSTISSVTSWAIAKGSMRDGIPHRPTPRSLTNSARHQARRGCRGKNIDVENGCRSNAKAAIGTRFGPNVTSSSNASPPINPLVQLVERQTLILMQTQLALIPPRLPLGNHFSSSLGPACQGGREYGPCDVPGRCRAVKEIPNALFILERSFTELKHYGLSVKPDLA